MAPLDIQQTFDLALQHHRAGRPLEAENLCRQILAQQLAHFAAMHLWGVMAHQAGRDDLAVDLLRRAVAIDPNSPEARTNLGNSLRDLGRLDEAIAAHRQAIALRPNFPEAYNNLGNALKIKGQFDDAIAAFGQAIALRPNYAAAFSNLGNALKDSARIDEAIAAFRRAIALNANLPEAHNNLGNALKDSGQLDEAIAAFGRAIALRPNYAEAYSNLGVALKEAGQLSQAIAAHRRAIELRPDYAEAHSNLGNALKEAGELDEAIAAYRHAVALRPDYAGGFSNLGNALIEVGLLDEAAAACRRAIALDPSLPEAHNNLGNALRDAGQLDEAIAAFGRAAALRPGYAEAQNNLGNALKDRGQLDEAAAALGRAIALRPDYAEAHSNLGNALLDAGQLDEAVAAYRQAVALRPDYVGAHSNLIFALQYLSPHALAEELGLWNRRHAEPLRRFIAPHANDRDRDRPLRVGYVSADFRSHSVSRFLLPLFRHHDHGAYRIVCYSDVRREDAMTEHLRACADEWHRIAGLTDERVADKVREDRIDILVDLAGHTAGNRLRVFASKPAPVQVTYLGYPDTTGLAEIDYRLTDALADPPGQTESRHAEKLWRLPVCNWCYSEPEDAPAARSSRADGPICFGSFNKFAKASPEVMELWAKILAAVPWSRLIVKSRGLGEQTVQRRIMRFFESRGVESSRLEIRGSEREIRSHLDHYNQLDIALDTFPYHGTTTTCEALWMGVPVISLAGPFHLSRVGVSLLSNVGLPELVAPTAEEYVTIAAALAGDLPRLAELRRTLRDRMRSSPLMDASRFARDIESAYRRMWRTWCETAPA